MKWVEPDDGYRFVSWLAIDSLGGFMLEGGLTFSHSNERDDSSRFVVPLKP